MQLGDLCTATSQVDPSHLRGSSLRATTSRRKNKNLVGDETSTGACFLPQHIQEGESEEH